MNTDRKQIQNLFYIGSQPSEKLVRNAVDNLAEKAYFAIDLIRDIEILDAKISFDFLSYKRPVYLRVGYNDIDAVNPEKIKAVIANLFRLLENKPITVIGKSGYFFKLPKGCLKSIEIVRLISGTPNLIDFRIRLYLFHKRDIALNLNQFINSDTIERLEEIINKSIPKDFVVKSIYCDIGVPSYCESLNRKYCSLFISNSILKINDVIMPLYNELSSEKYSNKFMHIFTIPVSLMVNKRYRSDDLLPLFNEYSKDLAFIEKCKLIKENTLKYLPAMDSYPLITFFQLQHYSAILHQEDIENILKRVSFFNSHPDFVGFTDCAISAINSYRTLERVEMVEEDI